MSTVVCRFSLITVCKGIPSQMSGKGSLTSEGILTLVLLPTKGAKSLLWAENLNELFTVYGREIRIFCSAPFVGNGMESEIKLPLGGQ